MAKRRKKRLPRNCNKACKGRKKFKSCRRKCSARKRKANKSKRRYRRSAGSRTRHRVRRSRRGRSLANCFKKLPFGIPAAEKLKLCRGQGRA